MNYLQLKIANSNNVLISKPSLSHSLLDTAPERHLAQPADLLPLGLAPSDLILQFLDHPLFLFQINLRRYMRLQALNNLCDLRLLSVAFLGHVVVIWVIVRHIINGLLEIEAKFVDLLPLMFRIALVEVLEDSLS